MDESNLQAALAAMRMPSFAMTSSGTATFEDAYRQHLATWFDVAPESVDVAYDAEANILSASLPITEPIAIDIVAQPVSGT